MYHILIRLKGTREWIDIGPVSNSYTDTNEGIIMELKKRMPEMAKIANKHYGSISGKEIEYYIGKQLCGNA